MQDFLLTPLLREAITYKLAHQVHNLRPDNNHALGPLDLFPNSIAATVEWQTFSSAAVGVGWKNGDTGQYLHWTVLPLCPRAITT